MQPVDLTTLVAICHELAECLPARLEKVHQRDRHTLYLCLRTLEKKLWLTLCWHPQHARLHLSPSPLLEPDTFTFSQQIWHQLSGLALVGVSLVSDWERVVDLQFAQRPGDRIQAHLYAEIMGKYSNAILVTDGGVIVTAAHQVSTKQSRVRPIQTGDRYEMPPGLLETIPSLNEPFELWFDRLTLIPQEIKRSLMTNYRGLSSSLIRSILAATNLDSTAKTDTLTDLDWQNLWQAWRSWLRILESKQFQPQLVDQGYTVLGVKHEHNQGTYPVNGLIHKYYSQYIQQQEFQQLSQEINQTLQVQLAKLNTKAEEFEQRLSQSEQAEAIKDRADLLMANLQAWQPGMKSIELLDFITNEPVQIALNPELNAVQNAQSLYKKHQKQKRAKVAIEPLLASVQQEMRYLEQVATAAQQLESSDLKLLQEIRSELIQQGYLKATDYRPVDRKGKKVETLDCHRYQSPSGFEIWIGRNNFQNDTMTFRIANDYDLWFHTQEIPGSHVLLRIAPGSTPDPQDLQTAADLAAYYSRARQSDRVPVIFTEPKYVFKPKGAKPGMVVYKHERVIWGKPQEPSKNPLLKFAGIFSDDPFFAEIAREIRAEREEPEESQ